ncbi:MAG: membrane or secreted protein [Cytophagales bacterium]|nr:membrane or secreted protein [Cytophagales bacterium]
MRYYYLVALLAALTSHFAVAQKASKKNPVYIDKQGTFRWADTNKEAVFFGVNYTTPFAHAYRAIKARGINPEDAIRQDVYHMARLGLDAFRVHVWDTEISDLEGNLLSNEHLRLYDFLLAELKKRNIKTIITPIAFWGNGYPEPDEQTPGFSRFYGRSKLTTNDSAIVAQERYLTQFFQHVNPYTQLTYQADPDIIAVEINNEPAHSGSKAGVTNYINRLASAIRNTGWSKPVFYNISQGPYYADAVASAKVDGFSFQWYPSGLVAGTTLAGNYLPHVDNYTIPFDTIAAYRNKGLMVYEFDAADILQGYMYPAMARSFRQAGMGWATQFAYDPMAIANVNTEYQTHYLNLAYTPSKAISLLVASRAFHKLPRFKTFGAYPADSVFDVFRVSYKEALSELNDDTEFIYSNTTRTKPRQAAKLLKIAGVGSSPVVAYKGSGAYFIDKLESGVYRLEVMPDAISVNDPFERASPKKIVTRLAWNPNEMQINLPDLGSDFAIRPLNAGNSITPEVNGVTFTILPGTYQVIRKGKQAAQSYPATSIGLNEFVAQAPVTAPVELFHKPVATASASAPLSIKANISGTDFTEVSLLIAPAVGRPRTLPMQKKATALYEAIIPEEAMTEGTLNYRIVIKQGERFTVFPGPVSENPFTWDAWPTNFWTLRVVPRQSAVELFNPTTDRHFSIYPVWRRGFTTSYGTAVNPAHATLKLEATNLKGIEQVVFQFVFSEKVKGRLPDFLNGNTVMVKARATKSAAEDATITLIDLNGQSFSAAIKLTDQFQEVAIPLSAFKPGEATLLPRPYPPFMPLLFKNNSPNVLNIVDAERIEVSAAKQVNEHEIDRPFGFELEYIWLVHR